jgi:hypothetical protein
MDMKILIALCLLFALAFSGAAQDATEISPEPSEMTPFLRALSLIPNTSAVREATPVFSYADYHAALEARGMPVPESLSGYLDGGEADGPLSTSLPPAGPSTMLQYLFAGGPEYPQTVGFDFFEIAQAVEFGTPPAMGQVLLGDFDTAMILDAYTQRGYTAVDDLLCPADGCDTGMKQNIAERNPANPFGGHLGRSEPIFVGDGVLLNSPDEPLVEAMAAAYDGSASSLADAPEFQAIAGVLAEYPYVSAVMAVSPLAVTTLDPRMMTENPEAAEALLASLEAEPLAPYTMTAFASAADGENEYGLALLVYVNAAAAQDAAAVIDNRLAALESVRTRQTYADILNAAGTLEPAQVVTDEATGLSVVVVRVTAPQPTNEEMDGQIVRSHLAFNRFVQMLYMRDTNWLVWGGEE